MSYDSDENQPAPEPYYGPPVISRDLEAIVTMLELSAIILSPNSDSMFTREELFREANSLGTDVCFLNSDMSIVLGMGGIVQRVKGGRYRKKP